MSVRFESNVPKVLIDTETQVSLALRFMLEGIDDKARTKTPKDKGNLRRDIIKKVLGRRATIVWKKEYAIYQETKQYKNYTTPNTGPHFAENAVNQVVNTAPYYFRKARLIK